MPSNIRDLRIPYAVDLLANRTIHADEIQERLEDFRDTLRLEASAQHESNQRRVRNVVCPACRQRVYPRHPTVPSGRYFWSHGPNTAHVCPLEGKRIISPDKVNSLIFQGRQEGIAHKQLVSILAMLAEQDPATKAGTIELGKYEPPSPVIRGEFPYGRFPDIKFAYGENRVVLEAQLAAITLNGINGRRAFYDRSEMTLIWVMRHFNPEASLRAYLKDIIADQQGVLFSIDEETIGRSTDDLKFRLRAWRYDFAMVGNEWADSVITLLEAIEIAKPRRWSDDFKKRWRHAYAGKSYRDTGTLDPKLFYNELAAKIGFGVFDKDPDAECLMSLVRLLISLEANVVCGSGHPNILSLANSFDTSGVYRAMTLVTRALERWRPDFFEKISMIKALRRARDRLEASREAQWGHKSAIGRMREALFPDWSLL